MTVYFTMVTASNITQTIPQDKLHSTSTSARTILVAVSLVEYQYQVPKINSTSSICACGTVAQLELVEMI